MFITRINAYREDSVVKVTDIQFNNANSKDDVMKLILKPPK